jgi:acetyl esterase/lipase
VISEVAAVSSSGVDAILNELKGILENPPPSIEGFRIAWAELMAKGLAGVHPVAEVTTEELDVAGMPATWISTSDSDVGRVILYLHGGGYIFGSVETNLDMASRLAAAGRARVLGVDYRLAPEHCFPAGIDDAVTAYRWLLDQGVDPARVVVVGDSAGGGIALAALARIREAGLPIPAAGITVSAWLDFEALGDSMDTCAATDPFVQRDIVLTVAALYLGGGEASAASPLYWDVAGLPPLLLIAGEDEVLVDDSRRMAEAAQAAGVDVTLRVWPRMYHDFLLFDPTSPDSQAAYGHIGTFIKRHVR